MKKWTEYLEGRGIVFRRVDRALGRAWKGAQSTWKSLVEYLGRGRVPRHRGQPMGRQVDKFACGHTLHALGLPRRISTGYFDDKHGVL